MKNYALLLIAFFAVAFSPAHALEKSDPAIQVEKIWARKTSRTASAAAYMIIHNKGTVTDNLMEVSSPIAAHVSLHRSYEKDGMMRMDPAGIVAVKVGEQLTLKPGGYHIMLMQLSAPLVEGSSFPLTLHFEHAGNIETTVQVTDMAGLK